MVEYKTVGDLRKAIENLPDEVPLVKPGRGDHPVLSIEEGCAHYIDDLFFVVNEYLDWPTTWPKPIKVLLIK